MVENARMSIELHEFWNAFMIGAVIFFVSNLSFVFADTPFSGFSSRDVLNTRTLFDLGGFAILYAYHIQCCQMRSRRDLESNTKMS